MPFENGPCLLVCLRFWLPRLLHMLLRRFCHQLLFQQFMIRRAPWALFVQLFTLIGTWYLIEKFFLKRVVFNLVAKESTSTSARSTSWSNQAFGPPYRAGSQVFTSPTCSLHIMKCSLNTFNAGWGKIGQFTIIKSFRQHSPHQDTSSTYAFVLLKVLGRVTTAYSLLIPFRENDMRNMCTALDPLDLIQRNHIVTPRSRFEHVWVDHSQHLFSNL